jgi:hypothetical protein
VQTVDTTMLAPSPSTDFNTDTLKSICELFLPATISFSPRKKIGHVYLLADANPSNSGF